METIDSLIQKGRWVRRTFLLSAALLVFWAGRRVGLAQGYGSDAEHDKSLDMMADCAERLVACDENRHSLAVACMEACEGCNDDTEAPHGTD